MPKHLLAALLHHHLPSLPCSTITLCNPGLTMVSSRVHWQGSVDLWTKKEWWVHFSNHCLTMLSSRVVWQNMCFPNYKWRKVWGPKNKQNKLQRYWTTTDCTHSKRNTVKYTQIFLPQWSDCLNLCKEVHTSLPIEVQISSKGCPGSYEEKKGKGTRIGILLPNRPTSISCWKVCAAVLDLMNIVVQFLYLLLFTNWIASWRLLAYIHSSIGPNISCLKQVPHLVLH
jgi:hypothetical protein